MGEESEGEKKIEQAKGEGCCFKISTAECVFPSLGRGPIGSPCLSLHSFMPRSEGEVKGTELFVGVCVCVRVCSRWLV